MTSPTLFRHVALLGIGLIGSSISHAARRANLAGRITGHARTQETRDTALRLGLVDAVYATPGRPAESKD